MANPNWKKGVSGNPKGKPKGYADFALRMRALADSEAVPILTALLHSKDERISFDAARFIVERGYGKAQESIKVGLDSDLALLIQQARARMQAK